MPLYYRIQRIEGRKGERNSLRESHELADPSRTGVSQGWKPASGRGGGGEGGGPHAWLSGSVGRSWSLCHCQARVWRNGNVDPNLQGKRRFWEGQRGFWERTLAPQPPEKQRYWCCVNVEEVWGQKNKADTGKGSELSVRASDFSSQSKTDGEFVFCFWGASSGPILLMPFDGARKEKKKNPNVSQTPGLGLPKWPLPSSDCQSTPQVAKSFSNIFAWLWLNNGKHSYGWCCFFPARSQLNYSFLLLSGQWNMNRNGT